MCYRAIKDEHKLFVAPDLFKLNLLCFEFLSLNPKFDSELTKFKVILVQLSFRAIIDEPKLFATYHLIESNFLSLNCMSLNLKFYFELTELKRNRN